MTVLKQMLVNLEFAEDLVVTISAFEQLIVIMYVSFVCIEFFCGSISDTTVQAIISVVVDLGEVLHL